MIDESRDSPSLTPTKGDVAQQRTVYLFGQPIAHSVSPYFHNTIFQKVGLPWRYIRLDSKDPEDLAWLMRRNDFMGAAVTMPNKVQALSLVDSITTEAQKIGCINTIYVRPELSGKGKQLYIGTNTDWIGIQRALLNADPEIRTHLQDHPALVIGGGATCRSAIYALTEGLGAKAVYLINRDPEEAKSSIMGLKQAGLQQEIHYVETVDTAQAIASPIVVVSAVPDIAPTTDLEHTARNITTTMIQTKPDHTSPRLFLEMCYDPTPMTYMANLAQDLGWKVIDGLDVMEHQAIEQAVLWTEKPLQSLPSELANSAIRQALHR
ncbi:hypothetical protein N7478_003881 [Penicillium angulare]|uniref:uncharacterized protein n=1 Tax=Penicillium angulare TaxID=116970 RepID=UPI00253F92DB|nr:uncharacterized protein N7478_003881 [Penicillium angulare]KAJ5288195.1 hypothetical protein N7478_003881 [Penicillium angulare]